MRNLSPYLVGNWRGIKDENSLLHDFSSNDHHGTITGATMVDGRDGQSLEFNGAANLVNVDGIVSDLASDTVGTFVAWVMTNDITAAQVIISFGDTDADTRIQFDIFNNGMLRALVGEAGVTQWTLDTDNVVFVNKVWIHVALVQDGTEPVLYVNGIAVAQAFSTSTDKTYWFNDLGGLDNGRIGCGNWSSSGNATFFSGTLCPVSIFNTDLSANEVTTLSCQSPRLLIVIPSTKMRRYFEFDGVDDYLSHADDPALNMGTSDFVVSTWIKWGGTISGSQNDAIFGKSLITPYWYTVIDNVGQIIWKVRPDGSAEATWATISSNINAGQWYHLVCFVNRSGNIGLYVDGVADNTGDISGDAGTLDNATKFDIASPNNMSGAASLGSFNGQIATTRIFNFGEDGLPTGDNLTNLITGLYEKPNAPLSEYGLSEYAERTELVTNGGFEINDPPNDWISYSGPSTFERSAVQKKEGLYSLHVIGSGDRDGARQPLSSVLIKNGKQYEASVWVYPVSGSVKLIVFQDGTDPEDISSGTGTWEKLTILFQADEVTNFYIRCNGGGGEFYADVASLKRVGEVAHWKLDETQSFKAIDQTSNDNDLTQSDPTKQPSIVHDLEIKQQFDPIFYEPLSDARISSRWIVKSGAFKPVYDSAELLYGIKCVTAGNSSIVLCEAYEKRFETSWKMKKVAGTTPYLQFIANKPADRSVAGSQGYYFIMNVDGSVGLYKYNAGSYFELFSTGAGYVNNDQWYDIRIGISTDGKFIGYIDDLEIVETLGSNPTEVDMTYVNSRYLVVGTGIGDVMSNFKAKSGLSLAYDPYVIGIPGDTGFGVAAVASEEYIPDGMSALSGCEHVDNDNYGNYEYADGSIMVFVPKFYYKITAGTNNIDIKGTDTYSTTVAANADGYALHRAFIDDGVEQPGFFVDKYRCSKNAWGTGQIGSSIKNGLPISTHADHNPIADLTACSGNYYYEVINAAHARDGVNGAVNPNSIFFAGSRFIHSALAMLSLAHGQASSSTTNCAWYHATYNYPKGCNNDALGDVNDGTVSYTSDGYLNCGKTGSGTPFAKTTHNGQNCGIADVNGLMWEIALGFTCVTAGGGTIADISRANPANVQIVGHGLSTNDYVMLTNIEAGDWAGLDDKIYTVTRIDDNNFTLNGVDTSGFTLVYVQGTNHGSITSGTFYLAKESTAMKDFTSGALAVTDHWGAVGVAAMMEAFVPAFETSYAVNGFSQRYGSGANQVLSGDVSGNDWKLTGLGFPKDADGIDTSGTNEFGKDYYYQYIRNQLCGLSFAAWANTSSAGVWAAYWLDYRTYSYSIVGWSAACYPLNP